MNTEELKISGKRIAIGRTAGEIHLYEHRRSKPVMVKLSGKRTAG